MAPNTCGTFILKIYDSSIVHYEWIKVKFFLQRLEVQQLIPSLN